MTASPIRLASTPAEYRRLGLEPGRMSPREDRTHYDGLTGSHEWWFMMADTPQGTGFVSMFTAANFQGELGLRPVADLGVNLPDGRKIIRHIEFDASQFTSLAGDAGVSVGPNSYRDDNLTAFHAHGEDGDLTIDMDLTPIAPPWRAEAGHFLFGPQDRNYFGFTSPVTRAEAHLVVHADGLDIDAVGTGYADRGWMNRPMAEFVNLWNWYPNQFGDYTVLAVDITFEEEFGYKEFPLFMVCREGRLLAGGPGTQNRDHIDYHVTRSHHDEELDREIVDAFTYDYRDGADRFTLEVDNSITISRVRWADHLSGTPAEQAAASVRDAAEVRLTGPATFTHYHDGAVVETITNQPGNGTMCELQYMGHPRR